MSCHNAQNVCALTRVGSILNCLDFTMLCNSQEFGLYCNMYYVTYTSTTIQTRVEIFTCVTMIMVYYSQVSVVCFVTVRLIKTNHDNRNFLSYVYRKFYLVSFVSFAQDQVFI